jgi:hypothetical protein
VIGTDFVDSGFAQANFMLFKQLLYFERYGKLYLADVPLLHDPVFFGALLTAPPLDAEADP